MHVVNFLFSNFTVRIHVPATEGEASKHVATTQPVVLGTVRAVTPISEKRRQAAAALNLVNKVNAHH